MADANYQVLVEFLSKHDQVSTGLSTVVKGTEQVVQKNKQMENSFKNVATSATNDFKGLTSNIGKSADLILNRWLGLGVALSGAGLLATINHTAEAIDRVTDSARSLGVSAQELQKFTYAAGLSGVGIDQVSGSLSKFSVNVGQAISGNADAIQSFKNVGISIDSLKGKDITQQYALTAQALANLSDKNRAAASGLELFGRDYTTALNLGRDGLTDNIQQFDKLGVALTDTQRKAVDAFGDAKLTFGTLFDGFLQKVTADVAPTFTKLISQVNEFITASGGIDQVATSFADKIISIVEGTISVFQTIYKTVSDAIDKLQQLANVARNPDKTLNDPNAGILDSGAAVLSKGWSKFENLLSPISTSLADVAVTLKTGEREDTIGSQFGSLISGIRNSFAEAVGANKNGASLRDLAYMNKSRFFTGYDPNNDQNRSYIPDLRNGSTSTNEPLVINKAAEAVTNAFEQAAKDIGKAGEQLSKSADLITGAFTSLDNQDKTTTLTEVLGIINDKGLVNPLTQTMSLPKDNPEFLHGSSLDPFLKDANGDYIMEKTSIHPTATNTEFEKNAAQVIADIKTGKYQGKSIDNVLDLLRSNAIDNGNAGLNNTGEIGLISEIKKFAESLGATTKNPQRVEISVTPTSDFIIKVADSTYTQGTVVSYAGKLAAEAASQSGN